MIAGLVVLIACGGAPEELVAARTAVDAWDRGAAALEAGDATAARGSFEAGLAARPDDSLLLAWRAQAEADAGDLDAAIATLDVVLRARPDFAEARYNRAAYLARAGRLDEAGATLRRALDDGACRPEEVLGDPDFAHHRGHAAFAFLPTQALKIVVEGRDEAAFWGTEVPVRLLVVGNGDKPVEVALDEVSGPISMVKVTQDTVLSTDGPSTEVVWTLKVAGSGDVVIGPWTVTSAGRTARHRAVRFEALAPPDKAVPPPGPPLELFVPDAIAGAREPLAVWSGGGRTWVRVEPGDRLEAPAPSVRVERRSGAVLDWLAHGVEGDVPLLVRRGSEVVRQHPTP